MPQPAEIDQLQGPLISAYTRAWDRVMAEQQTLINDPLKATRARRLREMADRIEAQMAELDDIGSAWVGSNTGVIYGLGAAAGAIEAGGSFDAWTQIHQQAVQSLAQKVWTDLLGATTHVNDTTKTLIREIAKDEALQKAIEGKTADQAARLMTRRLGKSGISAITYANGAKHGLAEYAQMAIRTTTATAYNTGSLNSASALGVKYFQCFDGPECGWSYHDDPTLASGLIVLKDEALAFIISHPNCRRSFGGRPDLVTPKDALQAQEAGGGGLVRQSQVDAQLLADRGQGPTPRLQRQPPRADQRVAKGARRQAKLDARAKRTGSTIEVPPSEFTPGAP